MSVNRLSAAPFRPVAVLAVLAMPMLFLTLYFLDVRHGQELRLLHKDAAGLARLIALQQEQLFRRVDLQLSNLVSSREIADPTACGRKLRAVMQRESFYSQIALKDLSGNVLCAASPSESVGLLGRRTFAEALASERFVLSDVVGDGRESWIASAAQPVIASDATRVVLVAGLQFDWAQNILGHLTLPEGSVVSLSDSDGAVIAWAPDSRGATSKQLQDPVRFRDAVADQAGTYLETAEPDGVERIFAYAKIPNNDLYVGVGFPRAIANAAGASALQTGFLVLAGAVALLGILSWLLTRNLVVGPIAQLAQAAERLGKGDWSIRTGLTHTGHLLSRMASNLDELASYGQSITRAFRTLSAGNRSLLREQSEQALLSAMCRVAVEQGEYQLAYVNYIEHDENKSVRTVAHHGASEGFLETLHLTWGDTERGRGSVGMAVRTNAPYIIRSMARDPRFEPWREEALKRGFGSIISLPLRLEGAVIGTFTLIAREEDAFDDHEVELLEEMAADLSFGIQVARATIKRRDAERAAELALTHDSLTGLPNRVLFMRTLTAAIEAASGHHEPVAILTIHLPRLQEVYDGFGFDPVNKVIKEISARLAALPETGNILARLSPNEFGVFLKGQDAAAAAKSAKPLLAAFREPVQVGAAQIDISVAIGASFYPGHGDDAEALLRRAAIAARDGAHLDAGFFVYRGATKREDPERLAIAAELRTAISRRDLELHFQPKINLKTGALSGSEALVRWSHPSRGFLMPAKFIPLAEETGLIRAVTNFVIEAAIRQQHAWAARDQLLPVAVNLSAKNLYDPHFLDSFESLLETWGVPPSLIEIELTEGALVDDPERAKKVLSRLRQLGSKIYIDDFGTGYSSLNYLVSLPVHALKIDRSFVQQMGKSREAHSVVASIISMAHNLDLRVVAEGVETEEDMAILKTLGCDEAQGYLFSKPVSAVEFDALFLRSKAG